MCLKVRMHVDMLMRRALMQASDWRLKGVQRRRQFTAHVNTAIIRLIGAVHKLHLPVRAGAVQYIKAGMVCA